MYKLLEEKGIESYCPLNKVHRKWSDRIKIVDEPLFKSYVFVKIEESKKWDLKKIHGVLNFVYWLGKPAVIREDEIVTIRKFLNEFSEVKIEHIDQFNINSKVRIKQGVMMNYQGLLLEVMGNKAKVRIESMGIYLNALFDKKNLELTSF